MRWCVQPSPPVAHPLRPAPTSSTASPSKARWRMATLSEKIRACAVPGGFGVIDVEDFDGDQRQVLTLSGDDLKTIADALEKRRRGGHYRRAGPPNLPPRQRPPRCKNSKSAVVAEAVAWLVGGQSPVATTSAAGSRSAAGRSGRRPALPPARRRRSPAVPRGPGDNAGLGAQDDSVDLIPGTAGRPWSKTTARTPSSSTTGAARTLTLTEAVAKAASPHPRQKADAWNGPRPPVRKSSRTSSRARPLASSSRSRRSATPTPPSAR